MSDSCHENGLEPLQLDETGVKVADPKKRDRRKKMKSILKEVSAGSSFSGVSHIASARSKFGILFWSLLLLGGLIGFGFNLEGLITRLMSGPVIETYIPEGDEFVWPDITLCNPMNPLAMWVRPRVDRYLKANRKKAIVYAKEIYKHFPTLRINDVIAMCSLNPADAFFDDVSPMIFDAALNSFYSDESRIGTYSSSDNFVRNFGSQFYARLIPYRYPTPCMTFNLAGFNNSQKLMNESKKVNDIKFFAIMNYNDYKRFNSYYENRRLSIYINAPGHTVSLTDRQFGVPGTDVFIEISMVRAERLKSRGKCVPEPFKVELYNTLLTGTQRFSGSHRDCEMYVIQQRTVAECGCYNTKYPLVRLNQTFPSLCLNMTIYNPKEVVNNLKCMKRVEKDPRLESRIQDQCQKYALPPCSETRYKVSQDSIPWTNLNEVNEARKQYLAALSFTIPKSYMGGKYELEQNVLILNVRKSSQKAAAVREEYSYDFNQFLSDVGGIVGLWLGFNIISLFELLEMLCVSGRYVVGR